MSTIEANEKTCPPGDIAEVGLGVTGDSVNPAVFTDATGLEPSRGWEKGEVYQSRSGQQLTKASGMWAVERRGSDVEQVAKELLTLIEPRWQLIKGAANDANAKVTVGIWWEPEGGQGGFSVSSDVMKRLAELCERVDVYFPG